jgi:hypothetical protein
MSWRPDAEEQKDSVLQHDRASQTGEAPPQQLLRDKQT